MKIGGRIWLEHEGNALVGHGRIELLEKIRDCGSISEAAKAMKMGYKAAWDTIDAVNRVAAQPVVTRVKGAAPVEGRNLPTTV